MIDFAPQLESSRLLTENLLTYCQMIGKADNLDKLERDWASKCLWVLRAYGKPTKQSLPLCVKDILAPLNRDFNYHYCFGNAAITNILKDLNTHTRRTSTWSSSEVKGSLVRFPDCQKSIFLKAIDL